MDSNMTAALSLLIEKWERKSDMECSTDDEQGRISLAHDNGVEIGKAKCANDLRQLIELLG